MLQLIISGVLLFTSGFTLILAGYQLCRRHYAYSGLFFGTIIIIIIIFVNFFQHS